MKNWTIELSAAAADRLLSLDTRERGTVANRIDRLARDGCTDIAADPEATSVTVPAGHYLLHCVSQPNQRRIVLALIEAVPAPTPLGPRDWLRTVGAALSRWARREGPSQRASGASHHRFGPAGLLDPTPALLELITDLKFALRLFRGSPGFLALTILTLGVGIGGNVAIFGVINTVYLSPLPLRDSHELLRLRDAIAAPNGQLRKVSMSPLDFTTIRESSGAFTGVVGMHRRSVTLLQEDVPQRLSGVGVSAHWSDTLGIEPVFGRVFSGEEERLGEASRVAIISYGLWTRQFGGAAAAIGAVVTLDSRPFTVVGVMPPGFNYPTSADVWFPEVFDRTDGGGHFLAVIARMKPDGGIQQAQAELDRISAGLQAEHPATNQSIRLSAEPAREDFIEGQDRVVLVLLAAVGFLLLIACVNVATLLIARFTTRGREIAIRAALGASRFRQFRQFVVETVTLFSLGGVAGLLLANWLWAYLTILIPKVLRVQLNMSEVKLDATAMAFWAVLSIVAGLVFGGVAALQGSRADLRSALKEGGRSTHAPAGRRVQRLLVVSEISLALALLVGAGLMIQQFRRLQHDDLGLDLERLITFRMSLQDSRYAGGEARLRAVQRMVEEVRAIPDVKDVAVTTVNPICCGRVGARITIEGSERASDATPITVHHRHITPTLHDVMGITVLQGRGFDERDNENAPPVVIIDERMARHFWPAEDPIGKRVRRSSEPDSWRSVIGVVGEVRDVGDYADTWYLPYYQEPAGRYTEGLHFMVRLAKDIPEVAKRVREAIHTVEPSLPVYGESSMNDLYAASLSQDRLGSKIVGVLAGFGLMLAALGVYGLMSYIVTRQSHEIGTRVALGAARGHIVRQVMRDALEMTAWGVAVGLAAVWALSRILVSLISGVEGLDPLVIASVTILLIAVIMLATYVPAVRAARQDPLRALRAL